VRGIALTAVSAKNFRKRSVAGLAADYHSQHDVID
jgi:hypothetical protein